MMVTDLEAEGKRPVSTEDAINAHNDLLAGDASFEINEDYMTLDRKKPLSTLQYTQSSKNKFSGQTSKQGTMNDNFSRSNNIRQDLGVGSNHDHGRMLKTVESKKNKYNHEDGLTKSKHKHSMRLLVLNENNAHDVPRKLDIPIISGKKRSVSAKEPALNSKKPKFNKAKKVASFEEEESSSDTYSNYNKEFSSLFDEEIPIIVSKKKQTNDEGSETNSIMDEEEGCKYSIERGKSYILKYIDKTVRILKESCDDISYKLNWMQKLCEKLTFAMAYSGLFTRDLGKFEIKKLSAALIKVVSSYPNVVPRNPKNTHINRASNSKSQNMENSNDMNTTSVDRDKAFQLAVLACNGLSLIAEDLSDDGKIIIRNGGVDAFIKRLNGPDHEKFAEHIIVLLSKLSIECPSYLTSKKLRAGIIKNIGYLDLHVQSAAISTLSNIINVIIENKKKQADSSKKSSVSDRHDLYKLFAATRDYLFSSDKKVVENTAHLLSMSSELIYMGNGSIETYLDDTFLARLVVLLNACINIASDQSLPLVSQLSNGQSPSTVTPFIGVLSPQAYSSIVKIIIFAVRSSSTAAISLVKKFGFMDVVHGFFVETPNHSTSSRPLSSKTQIIKLLLTSKSAYAFDLIHILSSLIYFCPVTNDILVNLSQLGSSQTQNLPYTQSSDTNICDLIVKEEAVLYSFVELLNSTYNFYLMYELINIFIKILWCSSMTSSLQKFFSDLEIIDKITCPCFDVGIGYYSKDDTTYKFNDTGILYIQSYVHNPHHIHARILFEQCLIFEHLIVFRYGNNALECISRNATKAYLERAIASLKNYYGSVDYYLRCRRGKKKTYSSSDGFGTINYDVSACGNNTGNNIIILSNKAQDVTYKKIASSRKKNSSDKSMSNTQESYQQVGMPSKKQLSPSRKRDKINSVFKNDEDTLGIYVDNISDDNNRITYKLCENLLGKINKFNNRAVDEIKELRTEYLACSDKLNSAKDYCSKAEALKCVAEFIIGKNRKPLNAIEFIESGILDSLLIYLTNPNEGENMNIFLQVFAMDEKTDTLKGAQDYLILLLNNILTLLGVFPNISSEIIGNISVPPRSKLFLQSCVEMGPAPLKNAFFWPGMPTPSEYYNRQLEKRLKVKLKIGDGFDNYIKDMLQNSRYNLHFLSDVHDFVKYIYQKIKNSKYPFSKNASSNPLLLKLYKYDNNEMDDEYENKLSGIYPKNIIIDTDTDGLLIDDDNIDDDEYEEDDNEYEEDDNDNDDYLEIANLLVNEGLDGNYSDVEYVPTNIGSIFGINDVESLATPVTLDITNTNYPDILSIETPKFSKKISEYLIKNVVSLLGDLAFVLPKELRGGSKYALRTSKNRNVAEAAPKSSFSSIVKSEAEYSEMDTSNSSLFNLDSFDLHIGEESFSSNEIITRAVYNTYLASNNVSPPNLYNAFFEVGIKKRSEASNDHDVTINSSAKSSRVEINDTKKSLQEQCCYHIFHEPVYKILDILKHLYENRKTWSDYKNRPEYYDHVLFTNTVFVTRTLRQLEDPITAFTKIIPKGCDELFKNYIFLFPYELRKLYFEIMTFGFTWVSRIWKARNLGEINLVDDNSRFVNKIRRMGNSPRIKIKTTRSSILETAMNIFFTYAKSFSEITIEYQNEVGAGLGPTLEFYSNFCNEVQNPRYSDRKSNALFPLWRNVNNNAENDIINTNTSLFPAPIAPLWKKHLRAEREYAMKLYKTLSIFSLIGCFMAKSIVDSRLIDLPFSKFFIEMIFFNDSDTVKGLESLELIKDFDIDLYNSLKFIKGFLDIKREIMNSDLSSDEKEFHISQIKVNDAHIDNLYLDFTYPGYPDFNLVSNGSNIPVTIHNVEKYLNLMIDYTIGSGISKQVAALRKGFNEVFPLKNMRCFYSEELIGLITDERTSLSYEDIISNIKTDHGYTITSTTIINFAKIVSELSTNQLRMFIQFMTGSTRLPKNGLKGLIPPLTIVKRFDNSTDPDPHLPSVMTCVNYLKLPDYSSIDVLRSRLLYSINEGLNSFHLS